MLNLFRVVACTAVLASHSFIWANMTGNVIGTGFITILLSHLTNSVNWVWPWARDLLTYQEFFVAGALVAFHFDQVIAFVAAHYRRIWLVTGISGGLMVLWYWIQVETGNSVERASQVSQPVAVIWCFAAIAGIFSFRLRWSQRSVSRHGVSARRAFPSVGYLAALTAGVYFSHTLFITTIRSTLAGSGLRTHLPWEATVAILFFGTAITAGVFISLLLRTPLRWVLGGPDRAAQVAAYDTWPHPERHSAATSEQASAGHVPELA